MQQTTEEIISRSGTRHRVSIQPTPLGEPIGKTPSDRTEAICGFTIWRAESAPHNGTDCPFCRAAMNKKIA